tara:strand:- start:297 stop:851 length:555 start_codon:yes stop_codon:yes gene_type:complete
MNISTIEVPTADTVVDVSPATPAQINSLVSMKLKTEDEAKQLTKVEASRLITQRQVFANTQPAGGLAISANQQGARTFPTAMDSETGVTTCNLGETRRSLQNTLLIKELMANIVELDTLVGTSDGEVTEEHQTLLNQLKMVAIKLGKVNMLTSHLVDSVCDSNKDADRKAVSDFVNRVKIPNVG